MGNNMAKGTVAKQVSTPMRAAYGVGTGIVAIKNMLFHFFFIYFFSNVLGVNELRSSLQLG